MCLAEKSTCVGGGEAGKREEKQGDVCLEDCDPPGDPSRHSFDFPPRLSK